MPLFNVVVPKDLNLNIIFEHNCHRKPFAWYPKTVFFNNKHKTGGIIMSTTAKVDQVFFLDWPGPVDKYNNATQVENVTFSTDDANVATIEAAPERSPYSAKVTTQKAVGATMVRINADADLGEGIVPIQGTHTVEVLAGDAVGFAEATATAPEDNADTPE